jgi:serine/threonine-protein kinase
MQSDAIPTIPGVRVLRRLGRGGMGSVFLALDESRRVVALKTISPDLDDPRARERFHREIEAVSSLRHANIVRLVRAGEVDGAPFALFERVRGRVLSRLGPQPWPVVVALGRQLAHATETVHAAGWLHRDIKRANVMVSEHGLVTLLDFGLAKRWRDHDGSRTRNARATEPGLTMNGSVVGTPRYLAPEIRRGHGATPATDVYALGLALHGMLGGAVDDAGRMTVAPARLPVALGALVAAALDPDPRRRPSATSVAAILDMLPSNTYFLPQHAKIDDLATWRVDADQRPTCDSAEPLREAS